MTGRLYSDLKLLAYPDRLEALRQGRLAAPVHIRIKPFNHCNHNCWYCAYRVEGLQLGEDMNEADVLPEAKMMEIVDDVIAMGVRAVTFSGGGEPLLYKPLPEVIRRLAEGGVKVASLTNGSALGGAVAEAFARHATWVRISIDAWDNDSYARSRGIKHGEFDRVMNNIRAFTARGSQCVLGISFIVTRENHPHIPEVCARFKEAGVNHVSLSGVVVDNDGGANNRHHQEIFAAVQANIAAARALEEPGRFSIINHYHELDERFDKAYTTCPIIQFRMVIGADQAVYSCQDKAFTKGGWLGSLKDQSFRAFWFSEENRARIAAINPHLHCRHHCVAHSRNQVLHEILALDPEHGAFV